MASEVEVVPKKNEASGLVGTTNLQRPPCRQYLLSTHINLLFTHFSTLFWAGDVFAPKLRVKNKHNQEIPIQQFLQNTFLDMWEMVARAVGDLDGVIGFQVFHYIHHYHPSLIPTDR